MTQLYVGNLSEQGDEKNIRALFGKYGIVREVLMKNGYAFVEMDNALQAELVMRELNGTDILGHPMIVEPSHQQRLSSRSRRAQLGIVEVSNIPTHMTLEGIENFFNQTIGPVVKIEIEDNQPDSSIYSSDFGAKRILVSFDNPEQAQRAATIYSGEESALKCTVIDEIIRPGSAGSMKNGRRSMPGSPSKGNNEFPLRILIPSEMVGAIIGKDGATIRHITQVTKARVDVHRRENLGSLEKAITIIGSPESCTEACYQLMRIMQNELLTTNGSIFDNGKHHFEPLPVVPLKVLAHNELVGRIIGKGGNTLKRIMAESGTKITISKLKDLTAYNMERTITILGTIDNCKKAESLISAKLRASYESDMTQFMQYTSSDTSPTHDSSPPHTQNGEMLLKPAVIHPQSLPTTPTAVRTFQDFSQEHTRLTTLHGSTGALEVNGLGGFYSHVKHHHGIGGSSGYTPMEPMMNGGGYGKYEMQDTMQHNPQYHRGCGYEEDDLTDVLQGLTLNKDPLGMGYGRSIPRCRRSSAPTQGPAIGWPESIVEEPSVFTHSPRTQSKIMSGCGLNSVWPPSSNIQNQSSQQNNSVGSIWSLSYSSRPESELSSYQDSDSSVNGFSPIYSPVTAVTSGFFEPFTSTVSSSNQHAVPMTSSQVHVSTTESYSKPSPNPSSYSDTKGPVDIQYPSKQLMSYTYSEEDDSYLDKLITDPVTTVTSSSAW